MLPPSCLSLILIFLETASSAFVSSAGPLSIPLTKRAPRQLTAQEHAAWAFRQRRSLLVKYGHFTPEEEELTIKRAASGELFNHALLTICLINLQGPTILLIQTRIRPTTVHSQLVPLL